MLYTRLAAMVTAMAAALATATPLQSASIIESRQAATCGSRLQALLLPVAGSTIDQINDGTYGCTTFEVLYCSGQYFKTRSINVDLLLSNPGESSGQILALGQTPTPGAARAGYFGYHFNATICPADGDYITGERVLSIYETTSGIVQSHLLRVGRVGCIR